MYFYYYRYYGLKPKLDEAYIRIKELERENDFLKWSKVVPDNTRSTEEYNKTFNNVFTQTHQILHLDKVSFSSRIMCVYSYKILKMCLFCTNICIQLSI